jgi:tRNA (guanine-N7-)-methyltransferase
MQEAKEPAAQPCGDRAARQTWRRSFGRRRGRKLSKRQDSLLSGKLEQLALDLRQPLDVDNVPRLFSTPVSEVWLEIGFGSGEHLIWQAEHHPGVGLIGAEPYVNGLAAALSAVVTRGLERRVRLHADDAVPLLDWLPSASLSRVFILFPDPWPKMRHRVRRLLSPAFLIQLSRALAPGGEFRFASDIADYAEDVLAEVKARPDFELIRIFTSQEREGVLDWPVTRYEAKAAKAGRGSIFLTLRRL